MDQELAKISGVPHPDFEFMLWWQHGQTKQGSWTNQRAEHFKAMKCKKIVCKYSAAFVELEPCCSQLVFFLSPTCSKMVGLFQSDHGEGPLTPRPDVCTQHGMVLPQCYEFVSNGPFLWARRWTEKTRAQSLICDIFWCNPEKTSAITYVCRNVLLAICCEPLFFAFSAACLWRMPCSL